VPCIVCIADRLQQPAVIPGVLSAEFTGFFTPAAPQPIARVTAITHRNGAVFQALLTGIGEGMATAREPHPEAALLTKASFLKRLREQFPTLSRAWPCRPRAASPSASSWR